jgi:hypothetical protein
LSDTLSNIIGAILAVLLLIIAPVLLFASGSQSATQTYVSTITTEFVDEVREVGYISPLMYEHFMRQLDSTKNVYKVEIIHKKRVVFDEAKPTPEVATGGGVEVATGGGVEVATGGGVEVATGGGVVVTPEPTWSPNDFYYNFYESEDILKTLYPADDSKPLSERYYYFQRGDYIEIRVYNEKKTLATRLLQSLTGASYEQSIYINYGGMIRNKGYTTVP